MMHTQINTTAKENYAGTALQKKAASPVRSLPAVPVIQKKENRTGLPDNLKSGMEDLSGFSMDDVKVHYNSDKPAQLNALAYAQGSDIQIGSGQEKHLPHEAWHVIQQKQGRVQPTMQMKTGTAVNDDAGLEHEADVMGEKMAQHEPVRQNKKMEFQQAGNVLQRTALTPATNTAMLTAFEIPLNT